MTLTEAGEVAHAHFREMLVQIDSIAGQLDDLKELRRGRLRIITVEGAVAYLLATAVGDFHALYPGVELDITTAGTTDAITAILQDKADVFIAFNALPHAEIRILAEVPEPLYAVVGPQHSLWDAASCSLRQISNMRYGCLTEAHGSRQLLDQALHKLGLRPRPVLVSNSVEALKAFARAAGGVTFMPWFAVQREVQAGELRLVSLIESELLTSPLSIGVRKHRRIPRATHELIGRVQVLLVNLARASV
jgi:DNA-binding transcriptional LysR family regulator